jgi:hypothetical protein
MKLEIHSKRQGTFPISTAAENSATDTYEYIMWSSQWFHKKYANQVCIFNKAAEPCAVINLSH